MEELLGGELASVQYPAVIHLLGCCSTCTRQQLLSYIRYTYITLIGSFVILPFVRLYFLQLSFYVNIVSWGRGGVVQGDFSNWTIISLYVCKRCFTGLCLWRRPLIFSYQSSLEALKLCSYLHIEFIQTSSTTGHWHVSP